MGYEYEKMLLRDYSDAIAGIYSPGSLEPAANLEQGRLDPSTPVKDMDGLVQYAALVLKDMSEGAHLAEAKDHYDLIRHHDVQGRIPVQKGKTAEVIAKLSAELKARNFWSKLGLQVPFGAKYSYHFFTDEQTGRTRAEVIATMADGDNGTRLWIWQERKRHSPW